MYLSDTVTKAPTAASHIKISAKHLPALDVLRGAAILAVIWHHYGYSTHRPGWWLEKFGAYGFPGTWASNGWLGVNLFFVLSGFVLYWPFASVVSQFEFSATAAD